MKKFLFVSFLFVSSIGLAFSQNLTLDDVFRILDENFAKYPFVHQIEATKTDDNRPQSVKIARRPYNYNVGEEDGDAQAEKLFITVIRGGYRYYMVFDFLPRREGQSARSLDIRNRTYGGLLSDLRPRQQAPQSSVPTADGE
jgi:hypothetical protein